MGLLQGICRVQINYQDADGMIAQYGHGFGKTWKFDDVKPGEIWHGNRAQVQRTQVWDYAGGDCEVIPEIGGAAPRGVATPYNMTLDNWTVESGLWRDTVITGQADKDFLWYYDGNPDQSGVVTSVAEFWPNLAFYLRHYSMPYNQTEEVFISIIFYGNDGADERPKGSSGYYYAYYLPLFAPDTFKYARLCRVLATTFDARQALGQDGLQVATDTIDEWQRGAMRPIGQQEASLADAFTVENTDGHLLLSWAEVNATWLWRPEGGVELERGKIGIAVQGHPVQVRVLPIEYPTSATLQPYSSLTIPYWMNETHGYYFLGSRPTGTAITVTGSGAAATNPDYPKITFTGPKYKRAVCYAVYQLHDPEFTAARSTSEWLFDGSETGTRPVISAQGSVNNSWRGASCDLELRCGLDEFVWKGNEKVTVDVDWETVTTSYTPGDTFGTDRQFTGYIKEQHRERTPDDLAHVHLQLHCQDGIAARLDGKKKMANRAAAGGMDAYIYLRHLLLCCGVAAANIDLSELISAGLPDLDSGILEGDLLFDYRPETEAVMALDEMARSLGMFFGVDNEGSYFVKERPEYVAGTSIISFTLDDDTITTADFLYRVTAERGHDEFRNYILAICGQGAEVRNWLGVDWTSHAITSATDFMGDDWWEVLVETDSTNPALIGQKRMDEVTKHCRIIGWESPGKADLWPDDFVKVQVAGLDVATDTVFKIIEKNWQINEAGDYTSKFLGAVV